MELKLIRYVWKVLKCDVGKRWIDRARNEVLHRTKGSEKYPLYNKMEERKLNRFPSVMELSSETGN